MEAKRLWDEQHRAAQPTTKAGAQNKTIYSLFLEVSTLRAVAVDVGSGQITANLKVEGYNAWGEMTRLFAYNPNKNVFYLLEANYTGPDNQAHNVTLYTVDPVSGVATAKRVPGVANFPTGFAYNCAQDKLIAGIERLNSSGAQIGYEFYAVDVETGAAQLLSSTANVSVRKENLSRPGADD